MTLQAQSLPESSSVTNFTTLKVPTPRTGPNLYVSRPGGRLLDNAGIFATMPPLLVKVLQLDRLEESLPPKSDGKLAMGEAGLTLERESKWDRFAARSRSAAPPCSLRLLLLLPRRATRWEASDRRRIRLLIMEWPSPVSRRPRSAKELLCRLGGGVSPLSGERAGGRLAGHVPATVERRLRSDIILADSASVRPSWANDCSAVVRMGSYEFRYLQDPIITGLCK